MPLWQIASTDTGLAAARTLLSRSPLRPLTSVLEPWFTQDLGKLLTIASEATGAFFSEALAHCNISYDCAEEENEGQSAMTA